MANRNEAMHLNPSAITFAMYTEEEMRKLCVMQIRTPIVFDLLGHPTTNGLHDPRLGPASDHADICATCFRNMNFCPGHFGYIELPLSVINPMFHKIIATVLKITCLTCYTVQLPSYIKHTISIQIKLLNIGQLTHAIDVGQRISELHSRYGTFENIPEELVLPLKEYEKLANNADMKFVLNKNTESLRNEFLNELIKQIKNRRTCMHCKKPMDRIQTIKNKILFSQNSTLKSSGSNSTLSQSVVSNYSKFVSPEESKKYLRKIWECDRDLLHELAPVLQDIKAEYPTDVFFFKILPVTPSNVRPPSFANGKQSENPQTTLYKNIVQTTNLMRTILQVQQRGGNVSTLSEEARDVYNLSRGTTALEKLNNAWEELQNEINNVMDKEATLRQGQSQGLKQIIEKKQGIIRKHMMGKRVNYAARSVITPDPNLSIDEIGIPEDFAKHLTYPVPVTPWNVKHLRQMILNGPNVHPGAVSIEYGNGIIRRLHPTQLEKRESELKRLLTPEGVEGVKIVHRHLANGDILLLNRQPTLHRPSIMAHTARILKGERTLRLHYANCKAYNADFDGDEMNAHFPQNEIARSEGYMLANVSNQYLVPKDGTPLSGLIQDHMIAGVKLTMRGNYFTKAEYHQLVFQALSYRAMDIQLLPPHILKPHELWSGKQVLSTVLMNIIPVGKARINLIATSKIPAKAWQLGTNRKWIAGGKIFQNAETMSEAEVIIRNGELLSGVLDKTHYGATPYGLVHCLYELYGGSYATRFLSSLARMFTYYLQTRAGFTLGVHDILVQQEADAERSEIIRRCRSKETALGRNAVADALDLPTSCDDDQLYAELEKQLANNPKIRPAIDRAYKRALDEFTNSINRTCLPAGLICKFPANNLQLMVQSGAKGSTVNTMQISCLLGQIELEGKRPPRMISGRQLPSFPSTELSARAGGFIDGRFMTGIRPQEFFFHCMAGREGLIDTAVKTSRSGYLQRCLIKHLEGLTVAYDMTVRDSDKSVIQFQYGEDGMDISKAQFFIEHQLKFLQDNAKAIMDKQAIKSLSASDDADRVKKYNEAIAAWKADPQSQAPTKSSAFSLFSKRIREKKTLQHGDKIDSNIGRSTYAKYIEDLWSKAEEDIKDNFKEQVVKTPMPTVSQYPPDTYFGSINERLIGLVDKHLAQSPSVKKKKQSQFRNLVNLKAMQAMAAPGEPVGLLAAQLVTGRSSKSIITQLLSVVDSVKELEGRDSLYSFPPCLKPYLESSSGPETGEPSTQMTLNTFHFAGRGDMNVTLGIPRLREILMMASRRIKTPSMEVPFRADVTEKKCQWLRRVLTRVVVAQVLEKIDVNQKLITQGKRERVYVFKFCFLPHELYKDDYNVKPKGILKYMREKFFSLMFTAIRKAARMSSNLVFSEESKSRARKRNTDDDDDVDDVGIDDRVAQMSDSSDEEPEDMEDAKQGAKYGDLHDGENSDSETSSDNDSDNDDRVDKVKAPGGDIESGDDEDGSNQLQSNSEEQEPQPRRVSNKGTEMTEREMRDLVVNSYSTVSNYRQDNVKHLWCELTFSLPVNFKQLDMTAILTDVAKKAVIWQTPNINRAIVYQADGQRDGGPLMLRTDGINIVEMFKYNDLLVLNRLYSNDIHGFAERYGIEAASKVIVKEVTDVFKVYGITVDSRHLLLIADYMTFSGSFEPLSRKGMESSASPLQQMSFEASLTFLKSATIRGKRDQLQSPSSCLMVGQPCHSGTGSFGLLHKFI